MDENNEIRKSEELRSFLFLTVVMVPVLTVMIIAAYGFMVWFYQMLIGGPPHHSRASRLFQSNGSRARR